MQCFVMLDSVDIIFVICYELQQKSIHAIKQCIKDVTLYNVYCPLELSILSIIDKLKSGECFIILCAHNALCQYQCTIIEGIEFDLVIWKD